MPPAPMTMDSFGADRQGREHGEGEASSPIAAGQPLARADEERGDRPDAGHQQERQQAHGSRRLAGVERVGVGLATAPRPIEAEGEATRAVAAGPGCQGRHGPGEPRPASRR